ncbi:MAG: class I SAM-dependent rRNA methyltransferase [Alphaproteobacteria bacterium]
MNPSDRPAIRLLPGRDKRVRAGHPWIYSNEIDMSAEAKSLSPGSLVAVISDNGRPLGTATFNPHALIAARVLSPNGAVAVDADFLADRFSRALSLRARLYAEPFYRLIHAEADGLGGLIVDRFGDVLVVQLTTAGMERLGEAVIAGLEQALQPRVIVLRCDSSVREAGAGEAYVRVAKGTLDEAVEIPEGRVRFLADLKGGQKTGWYFDQRDNRLFMAGLAGQGRVLDVYCYAGGFALQAAAAGAREVLAVDRSADALALAERTAVLNGLEGRCRFERAEAFAALQRLAAEDARFDLVIADPPAFVKSRKDLAVGIRGYRKLIGLAASTVAPGGFLFVASCSHNVDEATFAEQVRRGLQRAGRSGRIIRRAGAGPDHPVHASLPETAYLKAEVLQLD